MKGRRSTVRRAAAALGISFTMLVAAGAGASASPAPELNNYTAQATSFTLHLGLQADTLKPLTGPLAGVLGTDLSNINEWVSWANALGQWTRDGQQILGTATSQVFNGTLDPLIATLLATKVDQFSTSLTPLDKPNLPLRTASKVIQALDLQVAQLGLGNQKVSGSSALTSASTDAATSLASIDVPLAAVGATSQLSAPLSQLQGTINTVVDQINGLLGSGQVAGLTKTLQSAGLPISAVQIPAVTDLTQSHILKVGIMESNATTGVQKLASALTNGATEFRTAHAVNELANVDILDGLVHLDLIQLTSDAKLDNLGGNGVATPVTKIVGLKVGNNALNLTTGSIDIAGQTIQMPDQLKSLLNSLVVDVAGVHIEALHNTSEVSSGHARAVAESLKISIAPTVPGVGTLFALSLQGPHSEAAVDLGTVTPAGKAIVLGKQLRRTGLNDTTYFLVGPMLLGAAMLVRRFALSK